jgi:hypothetical protein
MLFFGKKIRRLLELLDSAKRPQDLNEVVKAVENTEPGARPQFQKRLKQELLLKHKAMAASASREEKVPKKSRAQMPRLNFGNIFGGFRANGFAFAVALLLVITVSGLISYPLIPAPQVEGYSLKEAVRPISYNAPIKVVFTQPMDHGSVEKAFHITPEVGGNFNWQGNSLLFVPSEDFPVGKTYAVTVARSAKSIFQKTLEFDYQENFEITGSPQVKLFRPADGSEFIPVDSKITILFDRPMTALASLDKGESVAPKINIDPATEGRLKWLGTNTISFIPTSLKYSTKYTVTVPKGTVSAEGGKTDQDFVYSFVTAKPLVLQTTPYEGNTFNGPNTKVRIDFNQSMDLERAKDFIHLYKLQDSSLEVASSAILITQFDASKWQEVPYGLRYLTAGDLEDNRNAMYFDGPVMDETAEPPSSEELQKSLVAVPVTKLPYGSTFFARIDKGMPGVEGTFPLEQEVGTVFKTVGDIKVTGTSPENGVDLETDIDKRYGIVTKNPVGSAEIYFSHPMDFDSLADKVTISPSKNDPDTGKPVEPVLNIGPDNSSLFISYDFDPSTSYTVTLKSGAHDLFGQTMQDEYIFKFKTSSRKPHFSVASDSDISILDANKPPVYYLRTVNVDSVHFNFKKLDLDEFKRAYSYGYVNYNALDSVIAGAAGYDVNVEKEFNKEVITKIDLGKLTGQSLPPGVYTFNVTSPGIIESYNKQPVVQRQLFVITSTGLAVKRSQGELMAWAASLKDGAPVANLKVSVWDKTGTQVYTGTTDKDGLVSFKLPEAVTETDFYGNDYTVVAENGSDFSLAHSTWSEGVDPWAFNINYDPFQGNYYVYSYTDRPIYRPGDSVYFKGLVRKDMDAEYKLPDFKQAHVIITDSQYEKVFEKDLDLNGNGTYNGEFKLGDNARTGTYNVETSLSGAPGPDYLNRFTTSFRIAEYRKPDYELKIKPDKQNYANGDTAKLDVQASFFFGAPLPDAKIEWTVKSQDYYFFIDSDKDSPYASQWFSFSDDGYFCFWGCEGGSEVVASGKAKLDKDGKYSLSLPLDITKKKTSQLYTVEITAFDLNNQAVSNRVILPVHSGEFYTGIMNQDYVVNKADPVKFDVITVDYDGKPLPGKQTSVSFYKRTWNTVKKKNVDSDFYYENSYDDQLVETKSVTTNDKGYAQVSFTAKEGGNFKGAVTAKDSKGNTIVASTTVYITSEEFLNWGRENNDKIELVADKNEYKPGDTAHILVKSPYQNVWALVTQERKGILSKKVVQLKSNSETIDIPITEASIPNLFVSVLLVKGDASAAGLAEPVIGANDERDVAAFKLGYATLQVDTSSKQLGIEVTSDKTKYHPGDEVTLKVKTADSSGNGVKAEVSIGVVDKSVLSLTETVTADLLNAFYRQRMLGVSTAHTLTKAISRVNVQVEAGLKGGGGARPAKRGIFKDTAHWEAVVSTDASGNGEIKFKLPDNLTTWQVLAIGITADTLVGSQKSELLVTKDVIVRPVLPRFLIVNDDMKVSGIVHNYTDSASDFDVSLDATGVNLMSDRSVKVNLKPGEEKKVEFRIVVKNETSAVFNFAVTASGSIAIGDALELTIPIQPYSFPEVVATSGVITDDKKHVETVWLPEGIDANFGQLTVSSAPTLAASITQGLEYLVNFPYGCTEQTASALLPNVVVKQVLSLPALKNTLVDEKTLQKNVEAGISNLYKYQQGNGGWGVWQTSEVNPYLTAYVLQTLNEAKKAGYTVDDNVIQRGRDYLKNYVNDHPLQKIEASVDPALKRNNRYEANVRAFIVYVLAETGVGDTGLTNNLTDYEDQLSLFGKAYLAMALQDLKNGAEGSVAGDLDAKIKSLKDDVLNYAKETPRGVHFEESGTEYRLFDTNERTTALVLQMLARTEPNHPYVQKILRNLLLEKKDGRYASTQETAVTLLAMVDYLKASKELEASYNGVITLNDTEKLNKSYTEKNISDKDIMNIALTEMAQDNQDNEIAFTKNGAGRMYYDMNLKYYLPTEQIKPRDEGIVTTHEYFAADDKLEETPIKSVKLGENIKGKITVIVPDDRYYVMVEDFLPAGLEGVDFSLNTSQQSLMDGKGGDYYAWYFNYSEIRDDRMMYFADYLPAGVYEIDYYARATTPGVFHDLPVLAQELYFPEVFGRSEGKMLEVTQP